MKVFGIIMLCIIISLTSTNVSGNQCQIKGNVHQVTTDRRLHFSWRDYPDRDFSWTQGRKYCKERCMDLVSIDTYEQWRTVRNTLQDENVKFIWTGGRKCNYRGCDQPRFQPTIENGWFWVSSKKPIPNPFDRSACTFCEWGPRGGLSKPQPDNRELYTKGRDEACVAVLNDLYKDGIKWHDIACHHKKFIICEQFD
ncbi:L-selectin-like [Tigriopus californicus]|uniref:L-selectin-like n=1 Tax=Tigriopus californicus TaxID=6832 RepID=UPI0027DAAF30|nr:L-selectin-like [Tigriopus californicus]